MEVHRRSGRIRNAHNHKPESSESEQSVLKTKLAKRDSKLDLDPHKQQSTGNPVEHKKCLPLNDSVAEKIDSGYLQKTDTGKKTCLVCRKTFIRASYLTKHLLTHSTNPRFKCDQCNKSFVQKSGYDLHIKRVHSREKVHGCSECNYVAKVPGDLQSHVRRMHSTERPHKCDNCELRFATTTKRNNHLAQVHNRGPHFSCKDCSYKTHTKNLLQMHIKVKHTETEGYKCEICGTVLRSQHSKLVHLRSHNNTTPYKCEQCDKEFVSSSRLAAHKKTHLAPECLCTLCGKKFINKHKLKIHEQGVHNAGDKLQCPWCKYTTSLKHNLKKHCKNVHDLDYPPRTGNHNIPIKDRKDCLNNGVRTIILPPPIYPEAIDIRDNVKRDSEPLFVVDTLTNTKNPNIERNGDVENIYFVEISDRIDNNSVSLDGSVTSNMELVKRDEKLDWQEPNSSYTDVRKKEGVQENTNKVSTLQKLLSQPKDASVQNVLSKQKVNKRRGLKQNVILEKSGEFESKLHEAELVQEKSGMAITDQQLKSMEVLENCDHTYFVIGDDQDIGGANIQEVVIDNSEFSM